MTLSIQQIHKSFNGEQVLDHISFNIKEGEFVSLIGPSGSGKSTLFHVIGGLLDPDKGDVYLNEAKITNQRGHISYMPQEPALFPWRTTLQNVLLGQELHGEIEN